MLEHISACVSALYLTCSKLVASSVVSIIMHALGILRLPLGGDNPIWEIPCGLTCVVRAGTTPRQV